MARPTDHESTIVHSETLSFALLLLQALIYTCDSVDLCKYYNIIYTVSYKNRATLFSIITPAFLGRFLYFLYQYSVETGIHTLQFIYSPAWWRHKYITLHVTKVYSKVYSFSTLNTLSLKICLNILSTACGNVKIFFFCQKIDNRISYKELEKTNIGWLSVKVVNNRFDRTHCDDRLQMCCLYVILVLLGIYSVETQVRVKW